MERIQEKETKYREALNKAELFDCNVWWDPLTDNNLKNYADFEDCLLAVCAKANRCDAIVTRNKKDFAGFDIPLLAPEELLAKF